LRPVSWLAFWLWKLRRNGAPRAVHPHRAPGASQNA
jgi:hypothetical protein